MQKICTINGCYECPNCERYGGKAECKYPQGPKKKWIIWETEKRSCGNIATNIWFHPKCPLKTKSTHVVLKKDRRKKWGDSFYPLNSKRKKRKSV